jgi:hypothetical protein
MAKAKIRKCDQGTKFAAALQREADLGSGRCDDAAAMAGFLDGCAQTLLGAVSPRLLWEGAQHVGLTSMEMASLIHGNPAMAMDLMWIETDKPVPAKVAAQVNAELDKLMKGIDRRAAV